jgi:hypothetical protein
VDSLAPFSIVEQPLPLDVATRWLSLGSSSALVLLLPTQTREDVTYYQADDVEALKIARQVGLEAAYLIDASERRYLNEFASGWALELAIGIAANVAAAGVEALAAYVLGRVRRAIQLGRHEGPEQNVPLKLQIGQFSRTPSGEPVIKNLLLEGPAGEAIEAIRLIVGQQTIDHVAAQSTTPRSD